MKYQTRIRAAVREWGGEATLAQIRGKVKYEKESADEAGAFYEALDGLVDEDTLSYDVEKKVYIERGE